MWKVESFKGFGLVIVWDGSENYDFGIIFLWLLITYKSKNKDFNLQTS